MNNISSDYTDIPALSEELLTALERRFPPKCPDINESERQIFVYKGKVELIQWLRTVQKHKLSQE